MKTPLYLSVQNAILDYIKDNHLAEGDKLPTFRELAILFQTSIYTVSTAAENLQSQGLLEIRPQAGTYIARDALNEIYQGELVWDNYLHRKKMHPISKNYAYIYPNINMSYPFFCEEFGWYPVFEQAVSAALKNVAKPDHLSNLKGGKGFMPLRKQVSEYIKDYGIDAHPDLIIISGSAFYTRQMIASTFFSEGDMYFIPSPSLEELGDYALRRMTRVECVPVPFDEEGMSVSYIASKINRRKKAYLLVSPVIQSNNGITMSLNRRKEIYNLCYKNNIPIIEMDEYRDFHPNPLPPLKAMDKHNIVIYIGTFERVLSRSIGVSWIVAPPSLAESLIYSNTMHYLHFQVFNQMIVNEALKSGMYRQFTIDIKEKLKEHYALLNNLLDTYMGDIAEWDRQADIFFWLKFADHIDVREMVKQSSGLSFITYTSYKFAPKNAIWITPIRFSAKELPIVIKKLSHLARKSLKQ